MQHNASALLVAALLGFALVFGLAFGIGAAALFLGGVIGGVLAMGTFMGERGDLDPDALRREIKAKHKKK
jgi:hypothetical protein